MNFLQSKLKLLIDKPEILYLIVATVATLFFAIVTPPFHGPDEDVHFFRAYQIARGDIILDKNGERLGSCLPVEIYSAVVDSSLTPSIRGYTAQKYDIGQIKGEILNPVDDPSVCNFVSTTNTYTYNPIAYTPAVVGVGVVNIFNGPPLMAMYIARAIAALSTVFISFLAIRLLTRRRLLFTVILLTPMMLFQQSVISIDGLSYAILALFVAYIISLYNSKNAVGRWQWIGLTALALSLCFLKPLLFLFIPIVLLLFRVSRAWTLAILALSFTVLVASSIVTGVVYTNISNEGAEGSGSEQQTHILKENPLRSVNVAWNTYMNPYGDGQTIGVIGLFGYADTQIPLWVYTVSVINIALALVFASTRERSKSIARGYRVGLISLMVLYFVGVNAAMYITYSPVGSEIFYGVQGRYFLPLLVLLPLLAPYGLALRDNADTRRVSRYTLVSTVAVVVLSLIVVFQRYYLFTP